MKNKKIVLITLLATMMTITGCKKTPDQPVNEPQNTVTTEKPVSTEIPTEEIAEDTTEESPIAQDEENGGIAGIQKLFANDETDESTGFLSSSSEGLNTLLSDMDIQIAELSAENMTDTEDVLYYFSMYNQSSATLVSTGDSNSYLTNLIYDNANYYVLFGSDAADAEEIEVFCQEGTTIEYWAIATKQDDDCILVPVIAGNAENGYYIVRPALISTGIDMSDTMSLVEQGIDFTTTSSPDVDEPVDDSGNPADSDDTDDTSGNSEMALTGEEVIRINIKNVENDGELLTVNYEMSSTFPVNVYLSDETILLNGEDITDSVTAVFEAKANDTIEDFFMIENYDLNVGDELVIRGMLTNDDTYEDLGEIEFNFVME